MSGRLKRTILRVTAVRGVVKGRRVAELAVTPSVRFELERLASNLADLSAAHHRTALVGHEALGRLGDLETHMPTVLNAIASMSGAARISARQSQAALHAQHELRTALTATAGELATLRAQVEQASAGYGEVRRQLSSVEAAQTMSGELVSRVKAQEELGAELAKHVDTISWLLRRVETVRAEMLYELRYGQLGVGASDAPSERIVNQTALEAHDLRLNLGAGHVLEPGYVNVDIRDLPGIDVVAAVDDLPLTPASVMELRSSHLLEHFPEEELRRKLLPYWFSLLKPGGVFRAVVPDIEEMNRAFVRGEISFESLRLVTYGAQEYGGDFHFTAFTPESLRGLLQEAGFDEPRLVARARENGVCLEFEMSAMRPVPS